MSGELDRLVAVVGDLARMQAFTTLRTYPRCRCARAATVQWAGEPMCDAHLPEKTDPSETQPFPFAPLVRRLEAFIGPEYFGGGS